MLGGKEAKLFNLKPKTSLKKKLFSLRHNSKVEYSLKFNRVSFNVYCVCVCVCNILSLSMLLFVHFNHVFFSFFILFTLWVKIIKKERMKERERV